MSVVRVENLCLSYPTTSQPVEALRGITFSVAAGERVAIVGRSGGGKSSLLRVLSGLLAPSAGSVELAGFRIAAGQTAPRAMYEKVGLVFQNYGLVPQLSAIQNVLCGRLYHQPSAASMVRFPTDERSRAIELLDDLGLGERIHTRSSRLSGGEQQRVAIARLLHQSPQVMLLDEPIASLDVHWAGRAIDRLAGSGTRDHQRAVIMVLHDLNMAREFADRVLVMHHGELVFDGPPEQGCRVLEALAIDEPTDGALGPTELAPASAARTTDDEARPATPAPLPIDGMWGKGSFYVLLAILIAGLYIWSAMGVDFSVSRIFGNFDHAANFLSRMLPPDFSVSANVARSLLETVQMALIGTTLAAIVSLPIATLAARNISARPFQVVARLVLNLLRTIPSIIWGLFFVAIVGLGPFPGILALTFYAAGYLGKFYYEGIESIDPRPLQALRTVGATPLQRFRFGVFPQVLPLMLGYTLYMLEYNVRAASILGVVGAGGIGFYLYTYINNFQYDRAATALLFLLAVVTVLDAVSSRVRARLMS
ncbi:phosphonate ABC transporter, permease protein PhnE [Lujinxingia litoralis]|uniref:Phosphonate ABC transporter, permease protein PhnE n=1 Tax=Lujinxingia litoralis TaxID=2211119 RepID=A0A328CCB2_9DELT|nr:phosphonate ABC transporter, permease protein PhnE [Lujinxingia litoralis]RAL24821.1 phosphonate ABC transporter, permease protein PhnE [Lujinxingia litoralis]